MRLWASPPDLGLAEAPAAAARNMFPAPPVRNPLLPTRQTEPHGLASQRLQTCEPGLPRGQHEALVRGQRPLTSSLRALSKANAEEPMDVGSAHYRVQGQAPETPLSFPVFLLSFPLPSSSLKRSEGQGQAGCAQGQVVGQRAGQGGRGHTPAPDHAHAAFPSDKGGAGGQGCGGSWSPTLATAEKGLDVGLSLSQSQALTTGQPVLALVAQLPQPQQGRASDLLGASNIHFEKWLERAQQPEEGAGSPVGAGTRDAAWPQPGGRLSAQVVGKAVLWPHFLRPRHLPLPSEGLTQAQVGDGLEVCEAAGLKDGPGQSQREGQ